MTKPHPLTDRMIQEIQIRFGGHDFTSYEDMRAAYDKGDADRLERVLHWLRTIKWHLNEVPRGPSELADQLEEAMRPQEDN